MGRAVAVGLVLVIVAGCVAGAWWQWFEVRRELRLPGMVETQEVRLSSRVGGRVVRVLVQEAQQVEPGQALVELEMPELETQRTQWAAQKAAAEALLTKLESGARPQEREAAKAAVDAAAARLARMEHGFREEEKEQARQELRGWEADLAQAQQDLQRERTLLQQNATATQNFELALARVQRLQAQVSAAAARVAMMERGYRPEEIAEARAEWSRLKANYELVLAGSREEDLAEARARIREIQARIDEIDVRRQELVVVAPERAVVESLLVRPGDVVMANQPVAIVLRAADQWVKAYVSEVDLGRIRLGQMVEVTCDAYPAQRFRGRITYIASESEFTPRNIQTIDERRHQVFGIKVRVDDPQGVFKSGMAADVLVPLVAAESGQLTACPAPPAVPGQRNSEAKGQDRGREPSTTASAPPEAVFPDSRAAQP